MAQLWYSQEPNNPFASASTRLMMIMHCNSVTNWWTFIWMLNFRGKSILKKALDCLHFLLTYLVHNVDWLIWKIQDDFRAIFFFDGELLFICYKKNHFKRPFDFSKKVRKINSGPEVGCSSKLYIPSTLNIDLILWLEWHTQLIVCAVKC